ncbi:MAG: thioredoxin [Candidatus Coatesbacteria bacterium]|nr:MAG: thioredoxin [Candidatus Coatesbacteria bacterium]
MAENLVEVTDANWEDEVINSDIPVLVDFWATWCVPCKMVAPIVEELSDEYAGKLKVGKLNVDDNPSTAAKYGIRNIPTVLLIKNGDVAEKVVGAVGKDKLTEAVNSVL